MNGVILAVVCLLACFLWGITSVINRIRRLVRGAVGATQARMADSQKADTAMPAAQSSSDNNVLTHALNQLRQASELHRSGVLNDQEFAQVKARLVARI